MKSAESVIHQSSILKVFADGFRVTSGDWPVAHFSSEMSESEAA